MHRKRRRQGKKTEDHGIERDLDRNVSAKRRAGQNNNSDGTQKREAAPTIKGHITSGTGASPLSPSTEAPAIRMGEHDYTPSEDFFHQPLLAIPARAKSVLSPATSACMFVGHDHGAVAPPHKHATEGKQTPPSRTRGKRHYKFYKY